MTSYSRVSWKEGTFLSPQHFQQFERALESHVALCTGAGEKSTWGLTELRLNETALARGRIEILRCVGLLPDGTPVQIPDADPPPFAVRFELAQGVRGLDIYLTLPQMRQKMAVITTSPERGDVRYLEQELEVPDNADPTQVESIEVAIKNFRVVVGTETPRGGVVFIKLGELYRTADGPIVLRQEYIPPCLRIGASPSLIRLLQDLVNQLAARANSLAISRFSTKGDGIDFASGDALVFWFFHTLNTYSPLLQHLLAQPDTHPQRVYEMLLMLLGSLSSFAFEVPARDYEYLPDRLAECFGTLDRRLRALLGRVFVTRFEAIPLVRKEHYWIARIPEDCLRDGGTFYLGARAELASGVLMAKLPDASKIADLDGILRLVRMAVGGIGIQSVPRPASPIPARGDLCYFKILTEDPGWKSIREQGALAIYIPNWIPILELELIALKPAEKSSTATE